MLSPNKHAFSLVEAIIAAFLLLTSLLVVAALVDSSLRTQAKAEQYLMASLIAGNEMGKLRGYGERYGMRPLDNFDGQSFVSEMDSGFEVRLKVKPSILYLPNSSLEADLPPAERKAFEDSARQVAVSVAWSPDPADSVKVVTLMTDWHSADFEVEVSTDDSIDVRPGESIALKATAGDIPDIVYSWYTEPLVGLGSIKETARDGQTATYVNRYRTPAGRYETYLGECRIVVRAQYRNVVKIGTLVVNNVDSGP